MRAGIDYRPALVNREGTGRYVRELVRGMHELNFDTNLGLFGYTLAPSKYTRDELGLAETRAELLRLRLPSRALPWLLRTLGKGVDDLVGGAHVYHHTYAAPLHVREAAEVVTVFDTIYTIPNSGFLDPEVARGMTEKVRELVHRADRVLVPTEYVGAEVVMSFGVLPAKVSVTGLGCDHVARHLPADVATRRGGGASSKDAPYLLTVSRVDARKNHLRILEAFELLAKEGYPHRWIVAGPPGYGSEIFERASPPRPSGTASTGAATCPTQSFPLLYAGADCFVFPSLAEGFGLPPLEAMACGAPVVASCVTSMPEVLGEAAFLVEPSDTERIFEATRRVLAEPEMAEDLRLRGRQKAREHTWKEAARHTLLAYQRALESREEGDESDGVRRAL